jgi:epoxyqueuosine reductase QueG
MIEDEIKKLAIDAGADLVGICSADSIKDKDFSDPNFLLPGAQSVISIAIGFDDEKVRKFISKEDRMPLSIEEGEITKALKRVAEKIKIFLEEKGFKAYNCDCNFNYRFTRRAGVKTQTVVSSLRTLIDLINKEKNENIELTKREVKTLEMLKKMMLPGLRKTPMDLVPNFSHRCAAVASGLGRIGFSGNVITERFGARILLNSIITDAKLNADNPLENHPCVNCKICEKSCQGGLFSKDRIQKIKIAGIEETIAKRNSYAYCIAVCSGMVGQNKFKEWSIWSPFRFDDIEKLPLDDSVNQYVQNMFAKAVEKGGDEAENIFRLVSNSFLGRNDKPSEEFKPSCGFCQLVCGPTIQNKKESYKSITESGCIEE